jgi:hypothetical protein
LLMGFADDGDCSSEMSFMVAGGAEDDVLNAIRENKKCSVRIDLLVGSSIFEDMLGGGAHPGGENHEIGLWR